MSERYRPILYHSPLVADCWRVRREIARLGVNVELRDALVSRRHRREVVDLTGGVHLPCLVLPQTVIADTEAILRFLALRFGR